MERGLKSKRGKGTSKQYKKEQGKRYGSPVGFNPRKNRRWGLVQPNGKGQDPSTGWGDRTGLEMTGFLKKKGTHRSRRESGVL